MQGSRVQTGHIPDASPVPSVCKRRPCPNLNGAVQLLSPSRLALFSWPLREWRWLVTFATAPNWVNRELARGPQINTDVFCPSCILPK